jgi:hypothetical protein
MHQRVMEFLGRCGQANPAKVSATGVICPALVGACLLISLLLAFDIF